jgi:hypothetical protein
LNNVPVYKFNQFEIGENGEIFGLKSEIVRDEEFFISYFDGGYIEKFLHKSDKYDINNKMIGKTFISQNGNRVTFLF